MPFPAFISHVTCATDLLRSGSALVTAGNRIQVSRPSSSSSSSQTSWKSFERFLHTAGVWLPGRSSDGDVCVYFIRAAILVDSHHFGISSTFILLTEYMTVFIAFSGWNDAKLKYDVLCSLFTNTFYQSSCKTKLKVEALNCLDSDWSSCSFISSGGVVIIY